MLHDFITANREALISRARAKASARPCASRDDLESGIPRFLSQVAETLCLQRSTLPLSMGDINRVAAKHARDLFAVGCTTAEVIHDYGDLGEAIAELAVDQRATIDLVEFHTLNRCIDTAITEAVTEYGRLKDEATAHREVEQLLRIAHDLRSVLQAALLSFQVVKAGKAGASGSAGAMLGRSLDGIRELVDGISAEARPPAAAPQRDA